MDVVEENMKLDGVRKEDEKESRWRKTIPCGDPRRTSQKKKTSFNRTSTINRVLVNLRHSCRTSVSQGLRSTDIRGSNFIINKT